MATILDSKSFLATASPLLRGVGRVLVGFSGGADSTALLTLLADTAGELDVYLEAVHFEHGIRGKASLADANWCSRFCSEMYPRLNGASAIPLTTIHLDLDADTPGIEAAARMARLEKWAELANDGKTVVALGHHADDRVETLFERLSRGGNSSALAGLRPSREVAGTRFVRPLLRFPRTEIERYLEHRGIRGWRVDSTNDDTSFSRNHIRHNVIPALLSPSPERIGKGVLRSLDAIASDADYLEKTAKKAFEAIAGEIPERLPSAELADLHPALLYRVVRLWLSTCSSVDVIPTASFIKRLSCVLARSPSSAEEIPLSREIRVMVDSVEARILRGDISERSQTAPEIKWNWKKQPRIQWGEWKFTADIAPIGEGTVPNSAGKTIGNDNLPLKDPSNMTACFDASQVPETLTIRSRRDGDKMIPFGADNPTRLKKLLESSGIKGEAKRLTPVLVAPDGKIIWAPGVRRAKLAQITSATINALLIRAFTELASASNR